MSTTQWILNLGLLGWVLLRNLGSKPVTRATFAVPLLIVAVAAAVFLTDIPTVGNDVSLEVRVTSRSPASTGDKVTVGVARDHYQGSLVKGDDGVWRVEQVFYLKDEPC